MALFKSFFQGGFECSTHRRKDGLRLDVIAATAHDVKAAHDYALLRDIDVHTVRDGLRWHLIEQVPGKYNWSSFLPMLRAANQGKTQVIWDLFHYGWPDHLDIWSPKFIEGFARFAHNVARLVRDESDEIPFYIPVNEISFMAWAGGQFAVFNPGASGRGDQLKAQLVRATIAAIDAIWEVDSRARIALVEPSIYVLPDQDDSGTQPTADAYNAAQFEAWDMISGALHPHLGGAPRYLDIIGINYYCHNQWTVSGGAIEIDDTRARKFSHMLLENYQRYRRPLFIAETGIEGDLRPSWFKYVCSEVAEAIAQQVPIEGICIYPIMNHPGWDDDRHCPNGLVDYSHSSFNRTLIEPFAEELRRQQAMRPL